MISGGGSTHVCDLFRYLSLLSKIKVTRVMDDGLGMYTE
jgi:hypothetical protein